MKVDLHTCIDRDRSDKHGAHDRDLMDTRFASTDRRMSQGPSVSRNYAFTVFFDNGSKGYTTYESGVDMITGYSIDEYKKDPTLWHRMIHQDDLAMVNEHIQRIHAGESIAVLEHRIWHKDGSLRYIRNTSVNRKGGNGKLIGYDGWISDITDLKRAEQQREELLTSLRHMASRDALTNLLNRRGFKNEMERLWKQASQDPFSIGLMIADVDHFKSVNDSYGHLIGDQVIKELARLIQSVVRDTDTVCRYAGDELVVILPRADLKEVLRIGGRMLEVTRAHVFCPGRAQELQVTVSIGAFTKTPCPGGTIEPFLSLADRALYRAKQSGRNRMCHSENLEQTKVDETKCDLFASESSMDGRNAVLLVVNNPLELETFKRMLENDEYRVLTASGVDEALAIARQVKGLVDVVVVDLAAGPDEGLELIKQLKDDDDMVVPLMASDQVSADAAIHALRCGVYDFIQKPVTQTDMSMLIKRALYHRRLLVENNRYQLHLEAMIRQNGRSLTNALEKEKESHQFSLEVMAKMMSARERRTAEHCQRVARIAVILGNEMGANADDQEDIRKGALLHDIGKVAIPDTILLKTGPLTEEEWRQMKSHPKIGQRIIQSSPALKAAAQIVLSHHEQYDGKGYPEGLSGEGICLGARIFAVVDAYDAMRSERPYAKPMSAPGALAEINRNSGTQFDPQVVTALTRCQEKIEAEGRWA